MKIGIIGSGRVAQTIGSKLLEKGNDVMISSRDLNKEKDLGYDKVPSPNSWKEYNLNGGLNASTGSFSDAAQFGEVLFNCTAGHASVSILKGIGKENLKGKILIDLANPLDFSKGMPPSLTICNTDSLGEEIQKAFPDLKVVKTLNTVSNPVMVNPESIPGHHDIFIAGNDIEAKKWATEILLKQWFGWKNVIDLGDITGARSMEMYLPLWLRLFNKFDTPYFNIKIVK